MVSAFSGTNQPEPSQAMYVNGKYLEQVVTGYRTLKVEGREPLNIETENIEISTRDGSRYKRRRVASRTLTIHFALTASSSSEFATRFDTLKSYLYKIENSQLVFDDENRVYYVGTYKNIKISYSGLTATGTISIECADPFKYAVSGTIVQSSPTDETTFTINYAGTYPAYPILTARSADHDCGTYIFQNQDGHIIRVGDPAQEDEEEEVDTEDATTIAYTRWDRDATGVNLWSAAAAKLAYGYITGIGSYTLGPGDGTYYYADIQSPGMDDYSYYVGPAQGIDLSDTYRNFEASFINWFQPSGNEGGGIDFYINNTGGGNIAGWSLWRTKGGNVSYQMFVRGNVVKEGSFPISSNPFAQWRTEKITKVLDTITFNLHNISFTITDPELAKSAFDAANISMIMYRQPKADDMTINNAIHSMTFRAFASTWEDVPNKIPQNGLVEVDTGSGEITVNGAQQLTLGAIENEFEDFKLVPGNNTILCSASSWVDDAVYTMKYREVFL